MATIVERLRDLQASISRSNEPDSDDADCEKLLFFEAADGLLHVEFYGSPFNEAFQGSLALFGNAEVAASLCSLTFRGPDEGANGTRAWDLTPLFHAIGGVTFPNLISLFIEPTAPEHHNQSILAGEDGYEEGGILGRLVAVMPRLRALTVPSAPDASFFEVGLPDLSILRVEAGYDHQEFILNLSRCSCFPRLATLDFGEFAQRYIDEYPRLCTPFEHYAKLFRSFAFSQVRGFTLRNPVFSEFQLDKLKGFRKDLQFYVIRSYGEYIR
jgi:hypothetical protein